MKILGVMNDIFFGVKISDAAKRLGMSTVFVKDRETFRAHLAEPPGLIIFDLNCTSVDTIALLEEVHPLGIPTLAFVSHVQTELRQRAVDAGCETVLARSAFAQNLPSILERYAPDTTSRS